MNRTKNDQHRIDREHMRTVLEERMGLDPETVGPFFLDSILASSLKESGCRSAAELLASLATRPEHWQLLVRHAAVGETWFFRDQSPFRSFVAAVRRQWGLSQPDPVRVLSYPCASGEEAYSMRIALAEAGIPPQACTIDGVDINEASLAQAREGVFAARAFRGCAEDFPQKYFTPQGAGAWKILPAYAEGIRFAAGNLLEDEGLLCEARYDIVFCRNLLIYLSGAARAKLWAALEKRMQPHALLIVGHAESGIAREAGYAGDGEPSSFAFQRKKKTARVAATPAKAAKPRAVVTAHPLGNAVADRAVAGERHSGQMARPVPTLETIRRDADAGQVEQAIECCRCFLAQDPGAAEGQYLLGILLSAQGNAAEAESAFRKTLYLDPAHAEAKLHLALAQSRRPVSTQKALPSKSQRASYERRTP